MEKSIGATDLRQRLTDVLQDIREARETYVVETFGRPQVAIIDLDEYRAFQRYQSERQGPGSRSDLEAGDAVDAVPASNVHESLARMEHQARARLAERLLVQVERISVSDLQRVLDFAEALAESRPRRVPGKSLLKYAGMISAEDAEQMRSAIEEGCEQISDEW
ncbi:MAG TPA: type II toxin-antitoxin system Phd/YefM family antitoxin [Anaerolineae bacterium]|nr:type II toxin-antitoxin system Phd/YefM family antitoxin [Anaerolineae bacterium]